LWALAAGTLPARAGNPRIDRTWRAWYATNRHTIGADPDLIVPGQRLVPPAAADLRPGPAPDPRPDPMVGRTLR
jgi:hypothetical protein